MVQKILNFLHRESGTLNQAAFLLGFFSILSQILGFLRDRFLAHIFGASTELDIYYAAFRIPDLLFVTVASLVSLSVLIPFIIEKDGEGREVLRQFVDNVFLFFSVLMFVSVVVVYIMMPQISALLFKGFSIESLDKVVTLSRLLLISPAVLGLSNLFGSITQAYNRFMVYAFAPVLYNSGIVLGVVMLSERFGISGVVYGVILGALLHLLIQLPFVWSSGLFPRLRSTLDWKTIERVVRISLPRTVTLSMSSIVFIFLVALAARFSTGSVSILSLSNNIQTISLSIIGVSYSLAAFPTLSRSFQEKNMQAFLEQMSISARFIIFWSLPFTALLIVLRAQVVRVLLGSGLFDWTATRLTAASVALFVFSTVFQSLILLFMRGFYSAGRTKAPFYINLFSAIALMFITHVLVWLYSASDTFAYFITSMMKVDDVPGASMLMLPLGFSLGMILNGVLLWIFFEREFRGFSKKVSRTLFEGVGASVIMGASAYLGLNMLANAFDTNTLSGILLQGLISGIIGIVVGVVVLLLLRSVELRDVYRVLHGKFWKTTVIATDPEIV